MKITPDNAAKWLELDARRLELEREVRAIAKEKDLLSTEFQGFLEAKGKDSIKVGDFRINLVDGRPSVAWKDEFVKIAGAAKAAELTAEAPVGKKIQVQAA